MLTALNPHSGGRSRMTTQQQSIVLVALGGLLLTGVSFAQERRIRRSDLPPEVEKTVAKESAGATVHGFSQERENGQTFYEAELTVDGRSRDVSMDAQGNVVEIEEEVALDALPADVKSGILAK